MPSCILWPVFLSKQPSFCTHSEIAQTVHHCIHFCLPFCTPRPFCCSLHRTHICIALFQQRAESLQYTVLALTTSHALLTACDVLQSHANRYKRHIVPMLSLSVDFYVRVFVRVYTSPAAVKDSGSRQMYVYQSQGCDSFYPQRVGRKV